jgi:hypothetical protein
MTTTVPARKIEPGDMFVRDNHNVLGVDVNTPATLPASVALYVKGQGHSFLSPDGAREVARRLMACADEADAIRLRASA